MTELFKFVSLLRQLLTRRGSSLCPILELLSMKFFLNSLDKVREISSEDGKKRKRFDPVVPTVNKKNKVIDESFNSVEQMNQVAVATNNDVLDLTQHIEVVVIATDAAANQVGTSFELVDLTDKSPWEKRKDKRRLVRGISTGSPTGSTEEGNNQFPIDKGEIVFTQIFEDHDK